MSLTRLSLWWVCVVSVILSACTVTQNLPDTVAAPNNTTRLTLPEGYQAEILVNGLNGPTQFLMGPDNTLWVAQLAGGENAGQGQVIAVSPDTGDSRILLENLDKPTGIAVADNYLWIAAGNTLLRAPINAESPITIGSPEIVLRDLPTNGRSNGTLTVTPQGELLYETSGARRGSEAAPNSATLWALDSANPNTPRVVATGFKNAYAHTFDSAGRLWTTDVADDRVNGQAPPDELNLVVEGMDYGWPSCYGAQEPALDLGGSTERCASTRASVATFPPHSTPVGLVTSPWDENMLLVALWDGPQPAVYSVAYTVQGNNAVGTVALFISGLARPQHLLTLSDGSLLVGDFETGTIYRITHP